MSSERQALAVHNLSSGICMAARIPDRVLVPQYKEIYVTDFRRLFSQQTESLLKSLMLFEKANTVALACFQQSKVALPEQQGQTSNWREDVFFVSADTEDEAYWSFIRRNWSQYGQVKATHEMLPPWLMFAEIVGACSDLGTWYLYCEQSAEIALLGFKERPGSFMEKRLYSAFGIEKLSDALKRDTFFGDPGNEYSKQQRIKLRSAYLS